MFEKRQVRFCRDMIYSNVKEFDDDVMNNLRRSHTWRVTNPSTWAMVLKALASALKAL